MIVSLCLHLKKLPEEIRGMASSDFDMFMRAFDYYCNDSMNPLVREDLAVGRIIKCCNQRTNLQQYDIYPRYGKSESQLIESGDSKTLNRRMKKNIAGIAKAAEEYKRKKQSRKE